MAREAPQNLTGLIDMLAARAREGEALGGVTVGDVLEGAGRRSYGVLLLVVGLFAISPATAVPGMTWFRAGLTLIIAGHLMLGLHRLWLPQSLKAKKFSTQGANVFLDRARPVARTIDSVLKPRLLFLSKPPFVNLIGAACVFASLVTFPLGLLPLAPLIPGAAIVLMGLGMVARDGVVILFGASILPLGLTLIGSIVR